MSPDRILNQPESLERIFDHGNFETLSPAQVVQNLRIVGNGRVYTIQPADTIDFDRSTRFAILVTGMPDTGKTTTLQAVQNQTSNTGFPLTVEKEIFLSRKPDNFMLDDYDLLHLNFGLAANGLYKLLSFLKNDEDSVCVFERGFVDQLAYLEALDKFWDTGKQIPEVIKRRKILIDDFVNYHRHFLHLFKGVVICNSTVEEAVQHRSQTPVEILRQLEHGFRRLPERLASMLPSRNEKLPIISIESSDLPTSQQLLKKSIYSLVEWNLRGQISAN